MRVPLPSSVSIPACSASSSRSRMVSSSASGPPASMKRMVLNSKEPPRTAALTRSRWQAPLILPMRRSSTAEMVSGNVIGTCPSLGAMNCAPTPGAKCEAPTPRASSSAKNGLPAARVWICCTIGSDRCETRARICSSVSRWIVRVSIACSRCRSISTGRRGWLAGSSISRQVPAIMTGCPRSWRTR